MVRFIGWLRTAMIGANVAPDVGFQRVLTVLKLEKTVDSDMAAWAKIFILRCPD
jgi:hypothetical protein